MPPPSRRVSPAWTAVLRKAAESVFFAFAKVVPSLLSSPWTASAYQVFAGAAAWATSGMVPSNTGQGKVTPPGGNVLVPTAGGGATTVVLGTVLPPIADGEVLTAPDVPAVTAPVVP